MIAATEAIAVTETVIGDMMRQRGFEIVSAYAGQGIHIPSRKTAKSAGYDLEAAETKVLAPHAVTVVPTGLKAYMGDDEYLSVFIRSSLAFKKRSHAC